MASPLIELECIYMSERIRWDNVAVHQAIIDEKLHPEYKVGDSANGPESSGSDNGNDITPVHSHFGNNGDSFGFLRPGTRTISIKGESEPDEFQSQLSFRLYGRWQKYHPKQRRQSFRFAGVDDSPPEPEWQFAFTTFTRCAPHGRAGTIRYLQTAPHVGQATASRLWERFSGDAVRILRESPEVAVAAVNASHFTLAKATEAAEHLRNESALENCTIDLIDLLGGRGFPKSVARYVVQEWGNRAAEVIRRDPYKLMAFRGCGFLKCDAMALDLGLPPARMKRQALAGWYTLASDSEGHTWLPVSRVVKGITGKIGGANCDPPKALLIAKRAGIIATRRDARGGLWVAEGKKARQELAVAERIAAAMQEEPQWPDLAQVLTSPADGKAPTAHQWVELVKSLAHAIGILRGSPGTGKSFVTAAVIRCLEELVGTDDIAVAAPTGKAAVRLNTALAEYGVRTRAKTIHSLLGVQSGGNEGARSGGGAGAGSGGWSFRHNEYCPLPYRFLFIDEASMLSTDIMASLLAARARGTCILFVGDTNQLPPIQHGAPLRDFIAAGVPAGELREIHRNAGTIVRACADIRDGKRFRESRELAPRAEDPENFKVVAAGSAAEQIERIRQIISVAKQDGRDPIWDCQVMVAVNKRSKVSRDELNKILQNDLNVAGAPGARAEGNPFRVRDKVICTDNGFYICNDPTAKYADEQGKCFVANGEFGEVIAVEPKLTVVRFSYPERVMKFPRGADRKQGDDAAAANGDRPDRGGETDPDAKDPASGSNIELAYACTVHKMQGSECQIAIVVLDEYPGAKMICKREWFFTALSRGKFLSLAVGKRATADAMCRVAALPERKTFLVEQIGEQVVLSGIEVVIVSNATSKGIEAEAAAR